jgi:hypothetical protein
MANGPIDILPLEFIPSVLEVGLFGAMSPNKKLPIDDLRERGGAGRHHPCIRLSRRVVVSSTTAKFVHYFYGFFGNGFVSFFILTELIVSCSVLPSCAITSSYWELERQNHGIRCVPEVFMLVFSCSGACRRLQVRRVSFLGKMQPRD